MIKLENYEVIGWDHAIRGMRNPMNSWEKSDTHYCSEYDGNCTGCPALDENEECNIYEVETGVVPPIIGPNDHELMMKLAKGGSVHAKYRRMITVYADITAPLYWWKEFDTYKVGSVANSCSTMHKIHEKEFTIEDFSCEHLISDESETMASSCYQPEQFGASYLVTPMNVLEVTIDALNVNRKAYLKIKELSEHRMEQNTHLTYKEAPYANEIKKYWRQMIQLLPSSYNQKRTVMLNYEVLTGIYESRKGHKLDEWNDFCSWIESLPYSEIITGLEKTDDKTCRGCTNPKSNDGSCCDSCDDFDCKNTPDEEGN